MLNRRMIRVIVQDDTGQRIPDASVSIKRAPVPPPNMSVTCDTSGEALMRILSIGQYEFISAAKGFETASVTAMITDAPISTVMVVLRPDL